MESCIIEMLIILNKKSPLGKTPSSFRKLLEATGKITTTENLLSFEELSLSFSISEYGTSKDAIFIKLALNEIDEDNLVKFTKALRTIKKISIENNIGNVQIIWDDISKHYSVIAYPVIHEIENLMRKLITKFMLLNVGLSWAEKSKPQEFAQSLSKSKELNAITNTDNSSEQNIMYMVDFIQLSNFLFKAYRELEVAELIKKITPISFDKLDEKTFNEIKKVIPETNWKKYFESSLDINSNTIIKDWKTLYDLRCCVAHNRDFTKSNLEEVIRLTNKLRPILKNAIDKTETLIVSTKDKNDLVNQFEETFSEHKKNDIELFKDAILRLFIKIKELYELAYSVENANSEDVKKIIKLTFDNVILDEKYTSSEAIDLVAIFLDEKNLTKYDNFELHDLCKRCDEIREVVIDKISAIEMMAEGPDSDE